MMPLVLNNSVCFAGARQQPIRLRRFSLWRVSYIPVCIYSSFGEAVGTLPGPSFMGGSLFCEALRCRSLSGAYSYTKQRDLLYTVSSPAAAIVLGLLLVLYTRRKQYIYNTNVQYRYLNFRAFYNFITSAPFANPMLLRNFSENKIKMDN